MFSPGLYNPMVMGDNSIVEQNVSSVGFDGWGDRGLAYFASAPFDNNISTGPENNTSQNFTNMGVNGGLTARQIIDQDFGVLRRGTPVGVPHYIWESIIAECRDTAMRGLARYEATPHMEFNPSPVFDYSVSSYLQLQSTNDAAGVGGTAIIEGGSTGSRQSFFPRSLVPGSMAVRQSRLPSEIAPKESLCYCEWDGCSPRILGTAAQVMAHIRASHLVQTDPVSGRVIPWNQRKHEHVNCGWVACGKPILIQSLTKHIQALHIGMGVICVDCGTTLKRRDEMRRHRRRCKIRVQIEGGSMGMGGYGAGGSGQFSAHV
ncbi:hypothetical protein B0H21DRAFT_746951 [Amylocystis lapponica]|nr:hypothetical protein B0H21DRAFT_746951 [Amylocystis lapponica]